jgi:hypothetical protein
MDATSGALRADPAAESDPRRRGRLTAGGLVRRTFSVWWKNAGRFFVVAWIPQLALVAASVASTVLIASAGPASTPAETFQGADVVMDVGRALRIVLFFAAFGALTHGATRHLAGERVRVAEMMRVALGRGLPLSIVGLVVSCVFVVGSLGPAVPALVFALALMVPVPVYLAGRIGFRDAFRRAGSLTKGSRLAILGAALAFGALVWAAHAATDALQSAALAARSMMLLAVMPLELVVLPVVAALPLVLPAVAHHDLRVARGVDASDLAGIFE